MLLVILGLAVSCVPAPVPATIPPTSTPAPPTLRPTDTPVPPTLTPAPNPVLLEDLTEWDLVVIGDSSAWGVADLLATHIESDLGVTVSVHDKAIGSLSAWNVLKWLREREEWRGLMRQAEMVTIYGNPRMLDTGDWNCEDPVNVRKPRDCSPESFEPYVIGLEEIIGEILAMKGDSPIIIRAMDSYVPILSAWKQRGVEAECTSLLGELRCRHTPGCCGLQRSCGPRLRCVQRPQSQ